MQYIENKGISFNVNKPLPPSPSISAMSSPTPSLNSLKPYSNSAGSLWFSRKHKAYSPQNQNLDFSCTTSSASTLPNNCHHARFHDRYLKRNLSTSCGDKQRKSDHQSTHEAISEQGPTKLHKRVRPKRSVSKRSVTTQSIFDMMRDESGHSSLRPATFYPQARLIDLPVNRKRKSFLLTKLLNRLKMTARNSLQPGTVHTKDVLSTRPPRPPRPPPHLCPGPDPHVDSSDIDPVSKERRIGAAKANKNLPSENKVGITGISQENRVRKREHTGRTFNEEPVLVSGSGRSRRLQEFREKKSVSLHSVWPEDSISQRGSLVNANISRYLNAPDVVNRQTDDFRAPSLVERQRRIVGRDTMFDSTASKPRVDGGLGQQIGNSATCSASRDDLGSTRLIEHPKRAQAEEPLETNWKVCTPHVQCDKVSGSIPFKSDQSAQDGQLESEHQRVKKIGDMLREKYRGGWEESQEQEGIDKAQFSRSPTNTQLESGCFTSDASNPNLLRNSGPLHERPGYSSGHGTLDEVSSETLWNEQAKIKRFRDTRVKPLHKAFAQNIPLSQAAAPPTKGHDHVYDEQNASLISPPALSDTRWNLRRVRSALRASSNVSAIIEQSPTIAEEKPSFRDPTKREGCLWPNHDQRQASTSIHGVYSHKNGQTSSEIPERSYSKRLHSRPEYRIERHKPTSPSSETETVLGNGYVQTGLNENAQLLLPDGRSTGSPRRLRSKHDTLQHMQSILPDASHVHRPSSELVHGDEWKHYSISSDGQFFF